ncbi:response regulator receiver domain-containing protein [Tenacibaculum skagerrakense]|uniref:Response regulator receiver domain-containing protein n=1 Tax=Tenacibaculum skagerrakense TaxID=186571 RepID=A0A4V2SLG2_9FLAO|nr:response regulator [Tenacibaculum skagerrakense]TCP23286.1 response regulator receiver domain-containing protein [Tenacibaculum skagerrakense]
MNILKRSLNILLIEDHMIEIVKFKKTVSYHDLKHNITEAKDADEAFKILEDKNNLPDLILLDLNMPRISGIEFLSILKKDEDLRHIPTVILTTSDNQKDLEECYRIGVSGYVLKPLKYKDYETKIEAILTYWSLNELKKY